MKAESQFVEVVDGALELSLAFPKCSPLAEQRAERAVASNSPRSSSL